MLRRSPDSPTIRPIINRGFILGYCHQLERQYGEMALAAWKAGILTGVTGWIRF
ncbi:DUF2623 family protein [Erwinia sp. CPCC 100877]|nr:DUF2623 family protein [Erwinia sp. CPCC 100877]